MNLIRINRNEDFYMPLPPVAELKDIVFIRQRSRPDLKKSEAMVNLPRESGRIVIFENDDDLVSQIRDFYPRSKMAIAVKID